MSAEGPKLCVNCQHCIGHGGRDIKTINSTGVYIAYESELSRDCGAGNTSDSNAICSNSLYKPRDNAYTPHAPRQTSLDPVPNC